MSKKLDGKVVVITGAGSGIGRETALLCARRGASLAVCDVNEAGLDETAKAARATGSDVLTRRVDVSDAEQVAAFASAVHERFSGVDLLINNAGIGIGATFAQTELEDWERQLQINVMGVVHGCRSFVPHMIERGSGQIVNVSSGAGFLATPFMLAYSATKFAVFGLSEGLRMELRPHGIGVTTLCPGFINTPIIGTSIVRGEHAAERQQKRIKLHKRRGYGPEKVAVQILKSAQRNRAVAPVTTEARLTYVMSRVAPPAARWMAARVAAAIG
jgi:NAD(P)-dependent dehydrogenase (short-subunit alcohol dehydrogenase family)